MNPMIYPPINVFIIVWFTSCTLLVLRQNEMREVFFSFSGSFLIAICFYSVKLFSSSFSSNGKCNNKIVSWETIKANVGLVTCFISLVYLLKDLESQFSSLAILTGYLAFDLWLTPVCRPLPCFTRVLEDSVTISCFLIMLSLHVDSDKRFHLRPYQYWISWWIIYKFFRLINYQFSFYQKKKHPSRKESTVNDLWEIHGVYYDLNDFSDKHPGGRDALELGKGRDCTALFESYHPFTNNHRKVLEKYSHYTTTSKKAFFIKDNFYDEMKKRVYVKLLEHGINPLKNRCATNHRILYYNLIFICLVSSFYWHICGSVIGSFLFALFGWLNGALGHDGGHFAVSRIPWLNECAVWGISLISNPIIWQHQHTYAHHSHTNDFDHDPDLHHFEVLLRVHRKFHNNKRQYRFQIYSLYVFFSYAFVVIGTCLKIPIGMMKNKSLYGMVKWTDCERPQKVFGIYIHFILYIALVILCPFYYSSRSKFLVTFSVVIHVVSSGLLFAIFSQINHLNELCLEGALSSSEQSGASNINPSWAVQQVETSNNFAPNSFFWYIFSNGLNLQIEHHLFPGLNHCHLSLIQSVVQQTCQEYGIRYKSYNTWKEIFQSTLDWLSILAEEI